MDHQYEQPGDQTQLSMNAVQFLEEQMGHCSLQQQDQPSPTAFNMSSNSNDRGEHQQIGPVLSGDGDELASLIPNPAVRKMYLQLELKLKSKPRVSEWDGFYHSSNIAQHSRLPFLTNGLAPTPHPAYKIVTSAGSIVLVRAHSIGYSRQQLETEVPIKPKVPIKQMLPAVKEAGRRRSRPKKPQQRRAAESSNTSSSTSQQCGSTFILPECPYCMSWDRLVVYNPQILDVRERVRKLPRPDCSLLSDRRQPPWNYSGYRVDVEDDTMQPPWEYRGYHGGVQATIVAQTDSYKIIFAFERYVIGYSSTANDWSYFQCQRPTPFGWDGAYSDHGCEVMSSDVPWAWFAASAIISGRLYCADVVQESHAKFVLRLFEVDYEAAATWKLQGSFVLRKRHWDFLPAEPSCSIGREMDSIRFLELVECMGQIYAVIPARIDEYLTTEFTSSRTKEEVLCADVPAGCHILPVQFHILRLEGVDRDVEDRDHSLAHRVLRIVVPHVVNSSDDSQHREELLLDFKSSKPRWANWFCCAAEGSVIFVAHEQYLLQYDVVSGVSKTGIIQETKLIPIPNTRYSRNVHMKP